MLGPQDSEFNPDFNCKSMKGGKNLGNVGSMTSLCKQQHSAEAKAALKQYTTRFMMREDKGLDNHFKSRVKKKNDLLLVIFL